jgi:hypothetical protein
LYRCLSNVRPSKIRPCWPHRTPGPTYGFGTPPVRLRWVLHPAPPQKSI